MKKSIIGIIIAIIVIAAIVGIYFLLTGNNQNLPENGQEANNGQELVAKYTLQDGEKNMTPGEVFVKENFGQEQDFSEIPSCAFQGTDKVYNYGAYEITTSDIDGKETIYSTFLLDDTIATKEGVKIADDKNAMIVAYGQDYEENGNEYIYTDGIVELSFIIENDTIISIQYVMVI